MPANIESVRELLERPLRIPNYQRPYKWTIKNVTTLIDDINDAFEQWKDHGSEFRYRIGTIILHEKDGNYDIVDGQQRIISLLLLFRNLEPNGRLNSKLCEHKFKDKISLHNLYANNLAIRNKLRGAKIDRGIADNMLEVVVITVSELSEAFQLFDSQNARGRALDPHDLLKAHHLRAMTDDHEMKRAVSEWESRDMDRAGESNDIRTLFRDYLFPISNWMHGNKTMTFSANDIEQYKGIENTSAYTYADRARHAVPYFQIDEPFIAGKDFFSMTSHYLLLLDDIKETVEEDARYEDYFRIEREILNTKGKSTGYQYAVNLFWCALMLYYDRFNNLEQQSVRNLLRWAMSLRLDMKTLGYASVNKYAIGEPVDRYTNKKPMFSIIRRARLHTEIANEVIELPEGEPLNAERKQLLNMLKKLN